MLRFRLRWVFLLVAVGLVGVGLLACAPLLGNPPDPQQKKGRSEPASILIVDRQGRLLYEVIDPRASKYVPLPLAEVPLVCRQATIATEDGRFYSHPGIDPLAILRAVWQNWRATNADAQHPVAYSGASTLTQQIARNLYLPPNERSERSLHRKLREAWVAWRLERIYSKDEILALYLNTTYYGHFAVGIEAAAQAYFGVHARELDLAQCALLAGLPQSPSTYNPIENPDAAHERQRVVLDLMVRDGHISPQQADDSWGERLAYASTPFPIEAPHFVMWVQSQLESVLQADALQRGGLVVTTTLDLDWQRWGEEIVRRRLALLRPCTDVEGGTSGSLECDPEADPARRVENAALVAIDPRTGAVRAMVGSPDYFEPGISGAVNGALSLRQPGSAIKPITYVAALDPARAKAAGHPPWTAATLIADLRTVFPTREGRPYVPLNYDRRFHGPVTVREALANSYNIPAVKTLEYIGVDALVDQATRMGIAWQMQADGRDPATQDQEFVAGIEDAPRSRGIETSAIARGLETTSLPAAAETGLADSVSGFGLALTLGGGEVRLLDLTSAYGALANGGFLVSPYAIDRVETFDGEALFSGAGTVDDASSTTLGIGPAGGPPRVLDARVAYLITDVLSDDAARRPAFGAANVLELDRPVAAKTGTTTDWRDNWTIGYSPALVTGVWVGNADNAPMRDVNGITGAGPIWHDFMMEVLRDSPAAPFPRPDGLVQVEICADSGLLPGGPSFPLGQGTQKTGNREQFEGDPNARMIPCPYRRLEWFISGTEPTEIDTSHRLVTIDARTGRAASTATPFEYRREQTYWALPPEYQAWARENGIEQPPPPEGSDEQRADTFGFTVSTVSIASPGDPPKQLTAEETSAAAHNPDFLVLTSPEPNRVYRIDSSLPAQVQQLPITVLPGRNPSNTVQEITVLLDGAPLATVSGPEYTAWWPLKTGRHTFQAMVIGPNGDPVMSRPVAILVQ